MPLREEKKGIGIWKYAALHKEQDTILEELKEYGYARMDEGSINKALTCWKTLPNVWFKDYTMQSKVIKPQELNIASTASNTETEQKKRKPQERVDDRYYAIHEYKT